MTKAPSELKKTTEASQATCREALAAANQGAMATAALEAQVSSFATIDPGKSYSTAQLGTHLRSLVASRQFPISRFVALLGDLPARALRGGSSQGQPRPDKPGHRSTEH